MYDEHHKAPESSKAREELWDRKPRSAMLKTRTARRNLISRVWFSESKMAATPRSRVTKPWRCGGVRLSRSTSFPFLWWAELLVPRVTSLFKVEKTLGTK